MGMSHKTGLFSSNGQTMKPVTCATIAAMSTIVFINRFESRELRDSKPRIAGTIQRQLVIMAPFTTSNSGRILKNNKPKPMVCKDSAMKIWKSLKLLSEI